VLSTKIIATSVRGKRIMLKHKVVGGVLIVMLAIAGLSACGEEQEKPAATISPTSAAPLATVSATVAAPTVGASPSATTTAAAAATAAATEPATPTEPSGVTTLALDMDPYGDTANDDRTVGSIESCISVEPGDAFDIDVVLDAIASEVAAGNLAGFQYFMGFDDSALTFTGQSHTLAGTNVIVRASDSCGGPVGCVDKTESVPDPPDSGSPPSPAVHDVFVIDPGGPEGPGPADPAPYAGGVLGRYTIQANPEAAPGIYGIGLNSSITYVAKLIDKPAATIWDLPGNGIDDDNDGAVDEDLMLDDTVGYGQVAIGVPCPEAPQ
jgi:hypothetical protein